VPFRRDCQPSFLKRALLAALLALLAGSCNSAKNSSVNTTSPDEKSTAAAGDRIDMNCMSDRIARPPEAFHYSFKSTVGGPVDKEAEITPHSMDITIQNQCGSHQYHGVRSDEDSWNRTVLNLSGNGITVMTARVDSIKSTSSVTRAGTAPVNGYQTTKYSIDTMSANSSDLQAYEAFFGSGSYEKGTIWVTADGCPVKLVLDEGRKQASSGVEKVHFEMDMVKR